MAKPEQLSNLSYTRTWLSADDFPTIEPDETKVREDLQFHPDSVKNYINDTLLPSYNGILDKGLHCPGRLIFSGAVTASYNGEFDVNVALPIGAGGGVTATTTIECTLNSDGSSVTFGTLPEGYANPFDIIKDSFNGGHTMQVKVVTSTGDGEVLTLAELADGASVAKFISEVPVLDALDTEWHVLTVSSTGSGTYTVVKGNPYAPIIGTTKPTNATVGVIGQTYLSTDRKRMWHCTAINNGVYTWEPYTAGMSTSIDTTIFAEKWTSNNQYTFNSLSVTDENISAITTTSAVELLPRETITREQMDALSWAMIVGHGQAMGEITIKALDVVPEIDIPVTLIIRRDL